jgi:ADP-heptose:LPS heptosyltransferase
MLNRVLSRRITVEIKWRLGDEVMALPVYEAIRRRWPGRRINVLCNYPELLLENPHVDDINQPAGFFERRICLRSGPRDVCRIEHYARLAGVPTPETRPKLCYKDWSTHLLKDVAGPFVAVCTGATWPSKRWPMENWRSLCRVLKQNGVQLVELGQAGESIGEGIDLTGKTSVREAACMLHRARQLICCDSGLMHLALAAGTPAVALFGPTEPHILVRNEPLLHAVRGNAPCQGCWNISLEMKEPGVCPRGRADCMEAISVEEAARRAMSLAGYE